ncbi:MAG TPA: hypothetical protein VN666_13425, partial [Nitrospira sp.]|nr:hypothetical protein [Nitrospira sp.]
MSAATFLVRVQDLVATPLSCVSVLKKPSTRSRSAYNATSPARGFLRCEHGGMTACAPGFPPRQRSSGGHRLDRRAPGGPESWSGAVRPACTRMPVLASEETARDCPRHPRPYGVLSAGRRSNGPGLPSRAPPVCASPRLVSPNEGGIHQDIFTVWIIGKGLEYPFPDTGLRPPVLALEYTVPC